MFCDILFVKDVFVFLDIIMSNLKLATIKLKFV